MKREIEIVCNNYEKQYTYKQNCIKYKKAMQEEFYFEAMLIAYAMLEDRLRSFLYHIGALSTRESRRVGCAKNKQQLKSIIKEELKLDKMPSVMQITGKIQIIRSTLHWALNVAGGYKDDKYLNALKYQYEGNIDIQAMLDLLDEIEKWLNYRNEVNHGLLNKNVHNLNEKLAEKTENGMLLAKRTDEFVKAIKKRNYIRKSINLSV